MRITIFDGFVIGGIIVFVILGGTFVSQRATLQSEGSNIMISDRVETSLQAVDYNISTVNKNITNPNEKTGDLEFTSHSRPPDAFFISINGHPESTYVTTIKRGQTANLDVFVAPKLPSIIGSVSFQNFGIYCSNYNITKCTPYGITSMLSTTKITKPTHLFLTINVPSDYPTGIYSEEIMANTTLGEPYQSTLFDDGDIDGFHIQVS